jgi:hypothetical protein
MNYYQTKNNAPIYFFNYFLRRVSGICPENTSAFSKFEWPIHMSKIFLLYSSEKSEISIWKSVPDNIPANLCAVFLLKSIVE